jgi:ubiquinone/menaquinone biosynthesis C-methylase UbiE
MMAIGESERGQVSANAAKVYEEFYLPGLFAEWPPRVIDAAKIQRGHRVVDVACGTGVLAQAVADRVGTTGLTVGVDINEGMLNIAREKAPEIEWHQAPAEALPLGDDTYDRVVCQFGLMYFDDQRAALREMMRVLRPGGNLAVVVWDKLERSPAYYAEDQLFQRVLGEEFADESPYSLGDVQVLQQLLAGAGISDVKIQTHEGTARFSSIDDWIYTDVRGWTIDEEIEDEKYERLLREARQELARFVTPEGTVAFSTPAHIVTASKGQN